MSVPQPILQFKVSKTSKTGIKLNCAKYFFFFLLDKDVTSCLVCKTLVNQIETTITDPTNEQAIADAVKGVCDLLFPNNMDNQNSCKAQIDNFIPVIVETIVNNFGNPDAICTALTLCP